MRRANRWSSRARARSRSPTTAAANASATRCRTAPRLLVGDGKAIRAGTQLASWDPLTRPIITEYAGTVKFEHVEEGVTVAKQIDEVTGLSTLVVIDAKRRGPATKGVRPQVKLINEAGEEVKIPGTEHAVTITFPIGALIIVRDGAASAGGRSAGADPDRVAEDARHHGRSAARGRALRGALAEGRGHAGGSHRHGAFGKDTKGKQRLIITDMEGKEHEYPDPEGQAHAGARRPGGEQAASSSSTAPPTRTTSCVCWGSRRWRATSSTKCRTSTASRA